MGIQEVIKQKINEVKEERKNLGNYSFHTKDIKVHLDIYIRTSNLDYAIFVLQSMLDEYQMMHTHEK